MAKAQVKHLLSLPKLEQKSEAWYEARANIITASDFAQALGEGKFGTQKQFYEKKVLPRDKTESEASKVNSFFQWGNMFEPVAIAVYSKMKKTKVHEFGLLLHPTIPFFGASPDGITEEGIMVEIKCPYKRKLTGEIPRQYYYQMQGQLDVCQLDDCDYFECTFEMIDEADFLAMGSQGIRGFFEALEDGTFVYHEPLLDGEEATSALPKKNPKYWVLKTFNLQRVKRDPEFLQEKFTALEQVWDKVVYYRANPEAFALEVAKKVTIDTSRYAFRDDLENEDVPPAPRARKPRAKTSLYDTNAYLFRDDA